MRHAHASPTHAKRAPPLAHTPRPRPHPPYTSCWRWGIQQQKHQNDFEPKLFCESSPDALAGCKKSLLHATFFSTPLAFCCSAWSMRIAGYVFYRVVQHQHDERSRQNKFALRSRQKVQLLHATRVRSYLACKCSLMHVRTAKFHGSSHACVLLLRYKWSNYLSGSQLYIWPRYC